MGKLEKGSEKSSLKNPQRDGPLVFKEQLLMCYKKDFFYYFAFKWSLCFGKIIMHVYK